METRDRQRLHEPAALRRGQGAGREPSGTGALEPPRGAAAHRAPPDGALRAVGEARRVVAGRLAAVKDEYPPVGRLALTGHAHLDLAWLWPPSETRRKAHRTFASVLSLMERYEDFVFNQSSAQVYRWMVEAEKERMSLEEAEGMLSGAAGYSSPFISVPF